MKINLKQQLKENKITYRYPEYKEAITKTFNSKEECLQEELNLTEMIEKGDSIIIDEVIVDGEIK